VRLHALHNMYIVFLLGFFLSLIEKFSSIVSCDGFTYYKLHTYYRLQCTVHSSFLGRSIAGPPIRAFQCRTEPYIGPSDIGLKGGQSNIIFNIGLTFQTISDIQYLKNLRICRVYSMVLVYRSKPRKMTYSIQYTVLIHACTYSTYV
jgi:hypothetical protein